jgi:hypothetical protein
MILISYDLSGIFFMENCTTSDVNSASVCRNADLDESLHAVGIYHITCFGADGKLKWSDDAPNLVVDQGKNAMLDTYFSGTGYSGAFYMSLITAGTPVAASTYAAPGITETSNAVIASRGGMTWVAASGGVKDAAMTSFAITGTATLTGNMVVSGSDAATVADTTVSDGILFSCATFSAGSKPVTAGDTLNVVYSIGL